MKKQKLTFCLAVAFSLSWRSLIHIKFDCENLLVLNLDLLKLYTKKGTYVVPVMDHGVLYNLIVNLK